MLKDELMKALLHGRSNDFKQKVEKARAIVENAFHTMKNPAVAFSTGKDSHVALHLVRGIAPDVVAHFGHEQWLLPETEAVLAGTSNLVQTALPDNHAEWFDVWGDVSQVPEGIHYIDPKTFNEFNYEVQAMGWDGKVLGLRAQENKQRRIFLHRMGTLFFCQRHGMWECNPVAFWTVWDIWAYIAKYDLPYNKAYDKLAAMGVPIEQRRIGPIAQGKVLQLGQMAILKQGWPELFNRFAAAHPEARNYT